MGEVYRGRLSRGQYKVVVEYDARYGYPVVADLDPRRDVFDDELYFRVKDFRPLRIGNGRSRLSSGRSADKNALTVINKEEPDA